MKKIIFAVLLFIAPLPAFASVFEGSYSGIGDAGKWMLFLNNSGNDGTIYMYSNRYYTVRYGVAAYNSVTGAVSVSSMTSPLYDVSSMTATISGNSLSGSWQSSMMGTGSLSGNSQPESVYAEFKGYRNLLVNDPQSPFMILLQFGSDGKATLYDQWGSMNGSGFIASDGIFAVSVKDTTISLTGRISNGNLTDSYWANYEAGTSGWPEVTERSCTVIPKSVSMDKSSFPRVGEEINFYVDVISECPTDPYYKYFYCPNYGAENFNPDYWVTMRTFSTDSSLKYSFSEPGYYIVVVWTSSKPDQPSPVTQGGFTIQVKN